MMELVPLIFIVFKGSVFGIGMFFAIKWHYDKEKKDRPTRAVVLTGVKVAAAFVLAAVVLAYATLALARSIGLDLSWP